VTPDTRLCEDRHDPAADWGQVVGWLSILPDHSHVWWPYAGGGLWVCAACGWACGQMPLELAN
jgi:hypothetical protein